MNTPRNIASLSAAATLIASIALLATSPGCTYETRDAVTKEQLASRRATADASVKAATKDFVDKLMLRTKSRYADAKTVSTTAAPPIIDILIISGGGDWGAFGAGFLKGWNRVPAGNPMAKPEFDVVTGVSTGALIAPFAFMGDDPSIDLVEKMYRNPKDDWSASAEASISSPTIFPSPKSRAWSAS